MNSEQRRANSEARLACERRGDRGAPRPIQNPGSNARDRSAFTLIEVVIVIVILVILAGFAWPQFSGQMDAAQIRESAARFKATIAMCRAEAMNEARRYKLSFRADGSVRVFAQQDAIDAPQNFVDPLTGWTRYRVLQEHVWVESVMTLPAGVAPVLINDDEIEFATTDELEAKPTPVEELETPMDLLFEPDGTSGSARWFLRDRRGRGLELVLDGRLGRLEIKPAEKIDEADAKPPPPLKEDEEDGEAMKALKQIGRRT